MQIIGLHLGPMNHTLWAWGPVISDLKILPADSNACQSLRTTDLILSEFSIPQQLLLIQQWPYVLCWHNKIEDIHLYFTSGDLSLSQSLLRCMWARKFTAPVAIESHHVTPRDAALGRSQCQGR